MSTLKLTRKSRFGLHYEVVIGDLVVSILKQPTRGNYTAYTPCGTIDIECKTLAGIRYNLEAIRQHMLTEANY